jgi:transcriptional regulator CtsR
MATDKNHQKLKEMIIKAIDDHKITRDEYDMIIHLVTEDGVIDKGEQTLLDQLQEMIENKTVRFVKG